MKISRVLLAVLCSGAAVLSAPTLADSFAATDVGGTLNAKLTMMVASPTCGLDAMEQTLDWQDVTLTELRAKSRRMPVSVALRCDSIPAKVTLTLVPAGGSTTTTGAGEVTGSLAGTGFYLDWDADSAVGTAGQAVGFNTPMTVTPSTVVTATQITVTEIKLGVTPVILTPTGSVVSGPSQATINIVLNYS